MQTITFTQKLLRQRSFLSALIPLFALFVGFGAPQVTLAQTITNTNFFVDNTAGTTNTTFGGSSAVTPNFNGANLGTFNINNPNDLLLNGGELTFTAATGSASDAPSDAVLNFRIFSSAGAAISPLQTIALVQTSSSGRTTTFSLSNAQRSLLALVPSAGTFEVDANFTVNTRNGAISDTRRTATFTATGTRPAPTGLSGSDIIVNTTTNNTPASNQTFGAGSCTGPLFQGNNFGTFDINSGTFFLNGGDVQSFESNGDVVSAARLVFTIVKQAQGTSPARVVSTSFMTLTQQGSGTAGNGGITRTFSLTSPIPTRNLIDGLANEGAGTFNVTVRFEADVLDANAGTRTITDTNCSGPNFTATFTTAGVPIVTATWEGDINDDWFNPGNWSTNRVPDMNTNAIIPDFGNGSTRFYPNIFAGVVATSTFSGQTFNNTNSGPALVRTLDMQGTSILNRSILRLNAGRLRVFGDFLNLQNSYIQRAGNTVIEFASSSLQRITNGEFNEVELSGGGEKRVLGRFFVTVRMEFLLNAGRVTTDISRATVEFVELANRSVDAPDGAQLLGERDDTPIPSFIFGYAFTNRTDVRANETRINPTTGAVEPDPRTFGNLGMQLLFTGANNPGDILVTRNTVENSTPLNTTTGQAAAYGIRRIFGVRPSNPSTSTGGLVATMVFRYLDSETMNLGPDRMGSISEPNLSLFVSSTSGNIYGNLGRDAVNTVTNELTKSGVRTFATFTLGDITRPLPVTLTGFDAKRVGADAVVTWETATEVNNRGYEVQVSTDGREFRTVGTVTVESSNSVTPRSYRFVDKEANKAGTRYYRLRQIDLDGKTTDFAPRAVLFDGKIGTEPKLTAFPSPFNSELSVDVYTAAAGEAKITMLDMTGRSIREQKATLTSGTNLVKIEGVQSLKSGIYIMRIVLPTGIVQSTKVVKQ